MGASRSESWHKVPARGKSYDDGLDAAHRQVGDHGAMYSLRRVVERNRSRNGVDGQLPMWSVKRHIERSMSANPARSESGMASCLKIHAYLA